MVVIIDKNNDNKNNNINNNDNCNDKSICLSPTLHFSNLAVPAPFPHPGVFPATPGSYPMAQRLSSGL